MPGPPPWDVLRRELGLVVDYVSSQSRDQAVSDTLTVAGAASLLGGASISGGTLVCSGGATFESGMTVDNGTSTDTLSVIGVPRLASLGLAAANVNGGLTTDDLIVTGSSTLGPGVSVASFAPGFSNPTVSLTPYIFSWVTTWVDGGGAASASTTILEARFGVFSTFVCPPFTIYPHTSASPGNVLRASGQGLNIGIRGPTTLGYVGTVASDAGNNVPAVMFLTVDSAGRATLNLQRAPSTVAGQPAPDFTGGATGTGLPVTIHFTFCIFDPNAGQVR